MKTFKNFIKKIAVFCVVGLAVFGVYTLFKEPPQLNISTEDRQYLQEIGIDATEAATGGGLSGVHGAVDGVPSLVLSGTSTHSEVPIGLMEQSSKVAPAFGDTNPATLAEAPSFATAISVMPAESQEAPPFSPPMTPAMITAPIGTPPEVPVPAVSPTVPQPPLTPPAVSSVQPVLPSELPFVSSKSPPQEPVVPQDSPPVSWDGVAADIYIISSSDSTKTAEDVAVSAPQPKTAAKEHTSVRTEPVLSVENNNTEDNFLKRLPVIEETSSKVKILSPPQQNKESIKTEVAASKKEESQKTETPAAIPVTSSAMKTAPVSLPQEVINTPVVSSPSITHSESQPYHQTSIRNVYYKDSKETNSPINQAQPIVSFIPQPAVQAATSTTVQKKVGENAVMPFSDSDAVPINTVKEEKYFTEPEMKNIPTLSAQTDIRETVEKMIKSQEVQAESSAPDKVRDAFIQLSKLYNEHNELNSAERSRMLPVLDRLALNVIYSNSKHILEPAYTVQTGDTIDSIATKFDLPAAILMKINGLTGARPLEPGMTLKTIIGPFDAKISVKRRELTLILGGLYAGRFTVALGERIEGLRGEYYVTVKTNTWNERVLTLNNGVTFRGQDRYQPSDSLTTVVRFTEQDAKELFDILSEHSVIVFED